MKQKIQSLFDKNNLKQTLLNTVYILFLLVLLHHFIIQLFSVYGYESWQISEFLINYQGGFVRRGLMGEILFFFAENFNINLEWTIKIISLLCFVAVCVFFVRSFLKKGYTLYILPLCFFLGGVILDKNWVRKEFLMMSFLIVILWISNKNNLSNFLKIFFINALLIFTILIHEVFAFFSLPVLFLLFCNIYEKKGNYKSLVLSAVSLLPSIAAFFLMLFMHGNRETAQAIWDSWCIILNQETSEVGYFNAIGSIGWTSKYAVNLHLRQNFMTIDAGISSLWVWCVIFPVVYYIATNALLVFKKNESIFTNKDKTVLSSVLIFQFLCLVPVFLLLSCDYGRVIFYWIASSFVLFILVPKKKIEALFPIFFVEFIERINTGLTNILRPMKTTLVFLMMFVGVAPVSFSLIGAINSSMIYNILCIFPEIPPVLQRFILNLF
jgi:hypothetical protein